MQPIAATTIAADPRMLFFTPSLHRCNAYSVLKPDAHESP
jgi:hypothetical protein